MKLEVWPVSKLKISTADLHNTILDDRSSVQSVGTLFSAILKCQIKTLRYMYGEAIKDVRSHHGLLYNVILFVVRTIYLAQCQLL